MKAFPRIHFDPAVMGGKPCIQGTRVTVATVVGLVASGLSADEIVRAYPYLQPDDIREALGYVVRQKIRLGYWTKLSGVACYPNHRLIFKPYNNDGPK